MVLELYIQGRSYREVEEVTGYSQDHVRELARSADAERHPHEDLVIASWRVASRARLSRMPAADLMYAWMDGAEPEDLADKYNVPADLLWDVISAEIAKTTRKSLRRRPIVRSPIKPLDCLDTCDFACVQTCAYTIQGTGAQDSPPRPDLSPNWPPQARLNLAIAIDPRGRANWTRSPLENVE
ncbi:hypothetical protein [Amycolatopsis sp. cmx-11-12]|uniref:hypothetical protein n=1 Tax=Amycolatopsis sp. cmx-11-12 TaxID=2785795 RepID=UPI003917DDAA